MVELSKSKTGGGQGGQARKPGAGTEGDDQMRK